MVKLHPSKKKKAQSASQASNSRPQNNSSPPPEKASSPVLRAKREGSNSDALRSMEAMHRQRNLGAQSESFRQSSAPSRGKDQQPTNISLEVWSSNHVGNIVLNSGGLSPELSIDIAENMTAIVTEKDINHFLASHTVKEFSFDSDNIERSVKSGFWPESFGKAEVLDEAKKVIGLLSGEIKEAIELDDAISEKSYECGDFKYTLMITTKADEDSLSDETGLFSSGTARLEQFYPISGKGFLFADKTALASIKKELNK